MNKIINRKFCTNVLERRGFLNFDKLKTKVILYYIEY
jgi:hypothetical protein